MSGRDDNVGTMEANEETNDLLRRSFSERNITIHKIEGDLNITNEVHNHNYDGVARGPNQGMRPNVGNRQQGRMRAHGQIDPPGLNDLQTDGPSQAYGPNQHMGQNAGNRQQGRNHGRNDPPGLNDLQTDGPSQGAPQRREPPLNTPIQESSSQGGRSNQYGD